MEKEKMLISFNKNMSKILDLQLAFESYIDNTGKNIPLLEQTYKNISNLRKNKDELGDEEKNIISNEILNNFEKLLDMVGRDKFIFYEDGKIEYEWDISLLKGENNGKR